MITRPGTSRCLYCLNTFPTRSVVWKHPRTNAPMPRSGGTAAARLAERLIGPPLGERVRRAREGYQPYCPVQGEQLPRDLEGLVVALVGAAGSSKSHYLAALVHELVVDNALGPMGIDVALAEESLQDYTERYERYVFSPTRSIIPVTPPNSGRDALRPVVLELTSRRTGRVTSLSLFDPAGEDLESGRRTAERHPYMYVADILLFLLDPGSLPHFGVLAGTAGGEGRYRPVLTSFHNMLSSQRRTRRRLLRPPRASVVLAKSDLCAELDAFDASLLADPDYDSLAGTVERLDGDRRQVGRFIQAMGAGGLASTLYQHLPGAGFHAVSATSCAPMDGRFPFVRPIRCVDPLIIPLLQLGLLDEDRDLADVV